MRSVDLEVGLVYRLGKGEARVTVLEISPELTKRSRVLVRFETGVTAGRITEVPTRRISGLAVTSEPEVERLPVSGERRLILVARPPRVGDWVTLEETGPIHWRVESIDAARQEAVLRTVVLERKTTATRPLDELFVLPESRPKARRSSTSSRPHKPEMRAQPSPSDLLSPIKPRREIDVLMDDVLFNNACLAQYERQLDRVGEGDALTRLREEIRRRGYLMFPDEATGRREVARIRVERRFDVVLLSRPSPEEPLTVDRLHVPANRSRRRRNARSSRPRAA